MRLPISLAIAVVLAFSAGGCGDSSDDSSMPGAHPGTPTAPAGGSFRNCGAGGERLGVVGADCATARRVATRWSGSRRCRPPGGASRAGCSVGPYRCLATASGRGWSVSCAKAGSSIAFTVRG
jgi:hypothetical protein